MGAALAIPDRQAEEMMGGGAERLGRVDCAGARMLGSRKVFTRTLRPTGIVCTYLR